MAAIDLIVLAAAIVSLASASVAWRMARGARRMREELEKLREKALDGMTAPCPLALSTPDEEPHEGSPWYWVLPLGEAEGEVVGFLATDAEVRRMTARWAKHGVMETMQPVTRERLLETVKEGMGL